uniref:Uncharacterized protein n=1 Tax=Setaria viridis TaxID=4556 RepID=A0A4U6TL01_SETVI|nr:hypothetical protein SEVIR_7G009900v2 [Setaria viridis]
MAPAISRGAVAARGCVRVWRWSLGLVPPPGGRRSASRAAPCRARFWREKEEGAGDCGPARQRRKRRKEAGRARESGGPGSRRPRSRKRITTEPSGEAEKGSANLAGSGEAKRKGVGPNEKDRGRTKRKGQGSGETERHASGETERQGSGEMERQGGLGAEQEQAGRKGCTHEGLGGGETSTVVWRRRCFWWTQASSSTTRRSGRLVCWKKRFEGGGEVAGVWGLRKGRAPRKLSGGVGRKRWLKGEGRAQRRKRRRRCGRWAGVARRVEAGLQWGKDKAGSGECSSEATIGRRHHWQRRRSSGWSLAAIALGRRASGASSLSGGRGGKATMGVGRAGGDEGRRGNLSFLGERAEQDWRSRAVAGGRRLALGRRLASPALAPSCRGRGLGAVALVWSLSRW